MMLSTPTSSYGFINSVTNLIMLVEDDIDHAELIMRTIKEHSIPNQVLHFRNGHSALDYLFHSNDLNDGEICPRPQVILLDIHLTDIDGIDVLKTIKASDELKMIPVVMLTTSADEADIAHAYGNHANSYLVKPLDWAEFKGMVEILCSYWLGKNVKTKMREKTIQAYRTVECSLSG